VAEVAEVAEALHSLAWSMWSHEWSHGRSRDDPRRLAPHTTRVAKSAEAGEAGEAGEAEKQAALSQALAHHPCR